MIKQLKINNKKSFDDFGVYIASRTITSPKKKSIKETIPFSNTTYDFSKINGEIYWEERTLEYSFDIAEITTEEMEVVKAKLQDWLFNVHDTDIYDPYIEGYHFHGSYDSDSWSEDFGAGTISVTFSVYPYKISNVDSNIIEAIGVSDGLIEGNYSISGLKIDGKSTQETSKGYSLVDFSNPYTITNAEITFENGVLTITTESTSSYDGPRYNILEIIKANAGKTLKFDFESVTQSNPIGDTAIGTITLKIADSNVYHTIIGKASDNYVPATAYYTIPEDVSEITSATMILFTNNSNTVTGASNVVTIKKPMLHIGTQNLEYEEYTGGTPKPNPDFPSEIVSIGDSGSVDIVSSNANLLSSRIGTTTTNGVTVSYDEDTQVVTLNGTCTKDNTTFSFYRNINGSAPLVIEEDETLYSKVVYVSGSSTGYFSLRVFDTNWANSVMNTTTTGVSGDLNKSHSYGKRIEYTRVDIRLNADSVCNNLQVKLMLSKVDCEYVPRQAISTTISLSEPLRSLPNGVYDTYKNGVITRRVGSVVLNGSETWTKNNGWETDGISCFYRIIEDRESRSYAICDKFVTLAFVESMVNGLISLECLRYDSQAIYIFIKTERLKSDDVSGFKTWLGENPITVDYELATPTTETVELPTITTYKPTTFISLISGVQTTFEVYYNESKTIIINNNSSHRIMPIITNTGNLTITFNNTSYSIGEGTYTNTFYLEAGENELTLNGYGEITFSFVEEVF